jgi:hypothetical protein
MRWWKPLVLGLVGPFGLNLALGASAANPVAPIVIAALIFAGLGIYLWFDWRRPHG